MQSFREGNQPLERTEGDAVVLGADALGSALNTNRVVAVLRLLPIYWYGGCGSIEMVSKSFSYGGLEGLVRVTFTLPADLDAQAIYVVGDFNNWDRTALPMRRARGGPWMATVDMPQGRAFQFRYLRDGEWMVDEQADAYAFAGTTTRNGLVVTDPDYRV